MIRKALPLVVFVAVAGVVGVVLGLAPAAAQTTTGPMRSFSAASVPAGGQFHVTIAGISGSGRVTETLPAGFSYVDDSASATQGGVRASVDGQGVTFTVLGATSFTYRVTASATGGSYSFSGVQAIVGGGSQQIGGDSTITVEAAAEVTGLMRSFSAASVPAGGQFHVTIAGISGSGRVTETLPAGFSYVDDSASATQGGVRASVDGQGVTFTVLGATSFTYRVTASATGGSYSFSGVQAIVGGGSQQIGGDSTITVEAAAEVTGLMRSFSPASVPAGGQFYVTIAGISGSGRVTETLPAGFSYVDDSASATQGGVRASVDGQGVTFTVLGATSFTYRVTASATGGSYSFSGVQAIVGGGSQQIGGDSTITVEAAGTAPPTATPTRTPTRPEVPTATPTRPPQPTATPIPTEVVPLAEVTPIPMPAGDKSITAVVQPDRSTVVETPDGSVSLTFPSASRSTTFQVSVDASTEACESADYTSEVEQLLCVTVQLFDAQGNAESNVRVNKPVTLTMMFPPEKERELGGFNTLYQAYLMGGLKLLVRDVPNGDWREAGPVRFGLPDTVLTASISNFSTVSTFALVAVQEVFDQVSGKATPTPVATATPTTPDVGGVSMPSGLLLLLAICSGLLVVMGAWVLRRAPR